MYAGTRLLSRADVAALLMLEDCIPAVETAFQDHALGRMLPTGVLGIHAEGGGFHIKAAGQPGSIFVTKINGNFSHNAERYGLPRIQGLIAVFDARCGYPLAVMDSVEITVLRTAAATGVAARYLARQDARVVTVAGCGRQAPDQLRAVAAVRRLERGFAFDADGSRARALARAVTIELGIPIRPVPALPEATRASDIVITCTSATSAILFAGDVAPGAFVAAVGADSDVKQEIDPALLAEAAVVPDLLDQAATIGDLHHAIERGVMTRDDVRGELGAVIAGLKPGRCDDREIVVFDSTGTALQDVAAAQLVLERAEQAGRGVVLDLGGGTPRAKAGTKLPFLASGARL